MAKDRKIELRCSEELANDFENLVDELDYDSKDLAIADAIAALRLKRDSEALPGVSQITENISYHVSAINNAVHSLVCTNIDTEKRLQAENKKLIDDLKAQIEALSKELMTERSNASALQADLRTMSQTLNEREIQISELETENNDLKKERIAAEEILTILKSKESDSGKNGLSDNVDASDNV